MIFAQIKEMLTAIEFMKATVPDKNVRQQRKPLQWSTMHVLRSTLIKSWNRGAGSGINTEKCQWIARNVNKWNRERMKKVHKWGFDEYYWAREVAARQVIRELRWHPWHQQGWVQLVQLKSCLSVDFPFVKNFPCSNSTIRTINQSLAERVEQIISPIRRQENLRGEMKWQCGKMSDCRRFAVRSTSFSTSRLKPSKSHDVSSLILLSVISAQIVSVRWDAIIVLFLRLMLW
jgi:hypothetical protein